MNIFDNLIKDTEIIGIGALNSAESTPGSAASKMVEYSFKVFTKASTIIIYSPAFDMTRSAAIDLWLKRYMLIREQVKVQINELEPNS